MFSTPATCGNACDKYAAIKILIELLMCLFTNSRVFYVTAIQTAVAKFIVANCLDYM